MLNSLKLLINRFRPKRETEHKLVVPEPSKKQDPTPRNQLIHIPKVDYESRQRMTEELHASDVTTRQRERQHMDKWFNRGEMTNSGSFRIAEFERRMEEIPFEEEPFIESLPAQEDMLMAFSKPEFDLFEEEKISLSGVFLRVDPNEDFDEQYSVPLLPMYKTNDVIMLDEAPSCVEEFNLNFSAEQVFSADQEISGAFPALKTLVQEIACDEDTLEETLQELIAVSKSIIPAPIPAFIQVPTVAVNEDRKVRIDPSALFEEWMSDEVFDASSAPKTPSISADQPLVESSLKTNLPNVAETVETSSIEVSSIKTSNVETSSIETAGIETSSIETSSIETTNVETSATSTSRQSSKSSVKLVNKATNDAYWSESDRLTRFGRRKTSASCSSTRLKALPQIA